ncbi:AcrR family transcriptional regulator [Rhizobium petrolearium]|uniref:TetR/AcrR family transcriptional regulator n=1 Tax=Neorhizobium petrolearium TaxID=515361 RepID=UPI001AE76AD4|nr:TetR/AcrR family transcriptional regulator [Neorhizobium petrolearium]MBP1843180.1 AcrR family transcriptional regulator [Neorhizobium petrolearium]
MEISASTPRQPQQKRSRERVERILAAAKELIARGGSDTMKMGELAERAGVPIGSLYQFFPDKSSVVRTLAERYNEEGRACIREAIEPVGDAAALSEAFKGLIDTYYGLFLAEPVMRDIWSGTQTDKTLQDVDLTDAKENGAIVAAALRHIHPDADPEGLLNRAMLVMYLGTSTMRLAISVGRKQGDAMVETYKRLALRELLAEA